MNDLFEIPNIKIIIKKLSNNINYLFGLSLKEEEIYEKELYELIFAIRAELLINNSKNERDPVIYIKINKIFNYLIELKLLDNLFDNDSILDILFEIFVRLKNFPFIRSEKFEKYKKILKIKYSDYLLDGDWMTPEQLDVYKQIKYTKNLLLSVSTSFGKTFLTQKVILEMLKTNEKQNIVIILPTNALISEYINFFNSKKTLKNIKIITEIYQTLNEETNLFILTQEKMLAIFSKEDNLKINWLIVDEFYNLDLSENRSQILFIIINKIYSNNKDVKTTFLLPGIKNANETILKYINKDLMTKTFSKYVNFSLASRDIIYLVKKTIKKTNILDNELQEIEEINGNLPTLESDILFTIVKNIARYNEDANFLIYSPKARIFNIADSLTEKIENNLISNKNLEELISYIIEFYGEQYNIIKYLKKGIGIHKSETDEFTRDILEEEFKKKNIKFLLCTPTLLKGVNLNTKFLFILTNNFPNEGSFNKIDARNLIGRIGRIDTNPHGFGFYIFNKNSLILENAVLNQEGIETQIIDKEYLQKKSKINDKKIDKINTFIEKISNDKKIYFNTKYIDNSLKKNNIKPMIQDYFLDKKIDDLVNNKIQSLSFLLKECFKFLFLKQYKDKTDDFVKWINKVNEEEILINKFDIHKIDKISMIDNCSLFLISTIKYIFDIHDSEWNDSYIYLLSLTFSSYLKSFSIKEIANSRAAYYEKYNRDPLNKIKYYYNGKDRITRVLELKDFQIFNSNNNLHMTILLDNLLSFIKEDIEYKLTSYINNISSKIFSKTELKDIQKQIDMLTINEKTIFLLENGFKRNIAVSLSTKKFDECFFKNKNQTEFYDLVDIIRNLINKLKEQEKKQIFLIKILEKKIGEI